MKSIRAIAIAFVTLVAAAGTSRAATFIGSAGDGKTSIFYDPATGEFGIDPDGLPVGLFDIQSASGIFIANATLPAGGLGFNVNEPNRKSWAALQSDSFNAPFSVGLIAPTGLSLPFLLNDLTLTGSGGFGTDNRNLDLIYPGAIPVEPPSVIDADLGPYIRGTPITHQFTTSAGEPPFTWSNLVISGPGMPTNPPTLSPAGAFSWNSAGSPLGLYNFDVTAANAGGLDVGRLSVDLVVPPPEPPVVIDIDLGDKTQGSILSLSFTTFSGDPPITWSELSVSGPGAPMVDPTLSAAGGFHWNTTGSPLGLYNFGVTASNAGGSDLGQLSINLIAPPPQPPIVDDSAIAALPDEMITYTFTAVDADTPITDLTWSDFTFEGAVIDKPPSFDPATQLLTWDTTGSPIGIYEFLVTASDPLGGSDVGTLRIFLGSLGEPEVPEPASILLLGPAIVALLGCFRKLY